MRACYLPLLAAILLPGCATAIDGTRQAVTIRTAPVGAACTLERSGHILADIPATPGTVMVRRERQDLTVTCRKPGWETTVATIPHAYTGDTAGNVLITPLFGIIGALVGVVVDEATRANYGYDQEGIILMRPPATHGTAAGPVATIIPTPTSTGPAAGFVLSHSEAAAHARG